MRYHETKLLLATSLKKLQEGKNIVVGGGGR